MKIGFLHSVIRPEEKLLLKEFKQRGVNLERIDDRDVIFSPGQDELDYDVVLERCINHSRAISAMNLFESAGVRCINNSTTGRICGDKLLTSKTLAEHDVPQPDVKIAFTEDSAYEAIEELGFPVVLKPAVGSWGRLLSKINDWEAAEAILEHKDMLGSYHHSIFYVQDYVEKPDRDIRSFVVGDECIAAIYRNSDHWITNTSRGAEATNCPITDELEEISVKASNAVNGDIVALDLFESDEGLLVNEANYTMEFRNSIETTGVDIPGKIVDYTLEVAEELQ